MHAPQAGEQEPETPSLSSHPLIKPIDPSADEPLASTGLGSPPCASWEERMEEGAQSLLYLPLMLIPTNASGAVPRLTSNRTLLRAALRAASTAAAT